jgi:hypothetical protein
MYGLGDNLHERAIVRGLMRQGYRVFLRTPWPQLFHDMVGPRLHMRPSAARLRTQAKNETAATGYSDIPPHQNARRLKVWYTPDGVRKSGSILGAMMAGVGLQNEPHDFRLPVPAEWTSKAQAWVDRWRPSKPIMLYRPLVERTEWGGCAHRNPDADAYEALVDSVRSRYFVVSVADLAPGIEWISGGGIPADVRLHAGELDVEALVGLVKLSSLVFCSPGFALVMAQAVGTPVVCVHGGREDSAVYSAGAAYTPTLGIDTIKPCRCFDHHHACERRIDVPAAKIKLGDFVSQRMAA